LSFCSRETIQSTTNTYFNATISNTDASTFVNTTIAESVEVARWKRRSVEVEA
jgi:hypothetical protein